MPVDVMDEYRPAGFRGILLTLVAVIAGVILSWQIASWGLNALDAQPPEFAPEEQVPGVDQRAAAPRA
jgi:hypothetical protein